MRSQFKTATLALAVLLSFAAPVPAGPLQDAGAAYDRGDYTSAMRLLRPLAEEGNGLAQILIGGM